MEQKSFGQLLRDQFKIIRESNKERNKMYKFKDYSGLMTKGYREMPGKADGITRDFKEKVEIIKEGLKIPCFLLGRNPDVPTYYLDTMIKVGDNIFYTKKTFLTKVKTPLKEGMTITGKDGHLELLVIKVGFEPAEYNLLVVNDYLNCRNQIWSSDTYSEWTYLEDIEKKFLVLDSRV